MDTYGTSQQKTSNWLAQVQNWGKSLLPWQRPERRAAAALYAGAVAQARRRAFYVELGVPDSQDARLELVQLHVILLMRRLQRDTSRGPALGQALFDTFFRDVDRSLREGGVGDLSVGKWVKKLAQQFYARVAAVEAALAQADVEGLRAVLRTSVVGDHASPEQVEMLVRYLLAADGILAARVETGSDLAALRFDGIDPIEAGSRSPS